ncbi:MAG: hypothetical protein J0L82_01820 [Deltaproteobacteria bacterium]|nr:hypothetical protein [Deltaproteobacteria bacterium]
MAESNLRKRLVQPLLVAAAVFLCVVLSPLKSDGATLFEGWSKVLLSGQHVGYIVQRYEFDEKKKEFRAIHYMKMNADAGGLTDSLVARADATFKPINYQYTGLKDGKPILIDAGFKGDKMTAVVTEGKEKKTVNVTLPKGAFLSTFLGYVMLQGKEGLKKGIKYEYQGVLEEAAIVAKGEAYIADEETVSGIAAFRILNTVSGSKYISLATHKAEVLGTVSPSAGVQTVLVSTMEEAVAGHGLNSAAVSQLFGSVPKGKENEVSRRSIMPPAAKGTTPTSPSVTIPVTAASPTVPAATTSTPSTPATNTSAPIGPPATPPNATPTPPPTSGK